MDLVFGLVYDLRDFVTYHLFDLLLVQFWVLEVQSMSNLRHFVLSHGLLLLWFAHCLLDKLTCLRLRVWSKLRMAGCNEVLSRLCWLGVRSIQVGILNDLIGHAF